METEQIKINKDELWKNIDYLIEFSKVIIKIGELHTYQINLFFWIFVKWNSNKFLKITTIVVAMAIPNTPYGFTKLKFNMIFRTMLTKDTIAMYEFLFMLVKKFTNSIPEILKGI